MERQLVVFKLANDHYGVDVAVVDNIVKMKHMTGRPYLPHFFEGITYLRDTVFPVLDLRRRFSLPAAEVTNNTRIIVVKISGATVGLMVDAVTEVLRISDDFVEPAPVITAVNSTLITGVAKVYDRSIMLLDLGRILTAQEQVELNMLAMAT